MTDAERTMREEGWILSNELFEGPITARVIMAIVEIGEGDAEAAREQIVDNPALKFYGAYDGEFSSAYSWEKLCEDTGTPIYACHMAIPPELDAYVRDFCRQWRGELWCAYGGDLAMLSGSPFFLPPSAHLRRQGIVVGLSDPWNAVTTEMSIALALELKAWNLEVVSSNNSMVILQRK